jgi:uncharacterized protein (TIGR03437 family)
VVASIDSTTSSTASVQFVETTAIPYGESGTAADLINLVPASSPPVLSGTAGQTLAPIQVSVIGVYGPLQNVQVRLQPEASGVPGVMCGNAPAGQQPGTVFTNSDGLATCNPLLGKTGTGTYTLVVGDTVSYSPTTLTVKPGPAAILTCAGGCSPQNVNQGSKAPQALIAQVTDAAGDLISGAAVDWTVTEGSATLGEPTTSTISDGQTSNTVTPTVGPTVQVTATLANPAAGSTATKFVYTINVLQVITGVTAVSGTPQTAEAGKAFTDPLIVQVNDNTTPVDNAIVTFKVTSGPVTLSAATAATNAQGQAQVTVMAGAATVPTPVVITASVTSGTLSYTATFNLTVNPSGPVILSVVNSAGFQNQFVSPCSLATLYGLNLTPGLQGIASYFIEPQYQVAGVTVQLGGSSGAFAPILDVANVDNVESVSFQVPCGTPVSSGQPATGYPVVVAVNGVASAAFMVSILPLSPGIFQFQDTDGMTRAVLVRQDGSFASATNPVTPGETVRMFATGLGQTTPPLTTNEFDPLVPGPNNLLVPQTLVVNASVVVGIDNAGVLVTSAQYAYGMVGVYEVDFVVPQSAPAGNNAPFAIGLYQGTNLLFGNSSLIPIQ